MDVGLTTHTWTQESLPQVWVSHILYMHLRYNHQNMPADYTTRKTFDTRIQYTKIHSLYHKAFIQRVEEFGEYWEKQQKNDQDHRQIETPCPHQKNLKALSIWATLEPNKS